MIPALDELKADEVVQVLTRAASLVLPNPHVDPHVDSPIDAKAAVLIERLKEFVGPKKTPSEVKGEIQRILTDRLISPYLTERNRPGIGARLIDRGLLRLTNYKLVINQAFAELNSFLQIRRGHIEMAVQQPTAMQGFDPAAVGFTATDSPAFLILTKRVPSVQHGESTLMVQGIIKGEEFIVGQCLRIFHESIERPADSSPLALLRAFVNTYGASLNVGERTSERFLFFDAVPWRGKTLRSAYPRVPVTENDPYIAANFLIRPTPFGAIEVTIMYAIRLVPYVQSLIAKGLPIDDSKSALTRASAPETPLMLD